jgi:MOSC domain-containing protein YiiM
VTLLLGGTTIVLLLGMALRSILLRRSSHSVVLPPPPPGVVESVSLSDTHSFSKIPCASIHLLEGLGVEGDAHLGKLVQHRSRLATRGHEPNLRQVHLIHAELLDYVAQKNSTLAGITAGQMGENILTRGVALLDLPTGTKLYIGASVLLEVTGLRNPCPQLDNFRPGLMGALREEDAEGQVKRLAGVMAVIRQGGTVHKGDVIRVELPAARPHKPLEPV